MSIYTVVEHSELNEYLKGYDIGTLTGFKGIEAGVENTNYFVSTTEGEFVLTLVESVSAADLPFILGFVAHLSARGVAVAQPIRNQQGELFGELKQKPAVFMKRLAGGPLDQPDNIQCEVIGQTMAQAHQVATELPADAYQNIYHWCRNLSEKVLPELDEEQAGQLAAAVQAAGDLPWGELPSGPVHADLFPDNALFDGHNLAGLIDFYHACSTAYLYDLAVTLNAWCFDEEKQFYDTDKERLLLAGYESVRLLSDQERQCLPAMKRVAALRFWLSRLRDTLFPKEGELITVKDPEGKRQLLTFLENQG